MTTITEFADEVFPEEGTRVLKIDFTDEDGDAVTPNDGSIKWSLTNKPVSFSTDPTVINSRDQIEVETEASTIYIALSGDDLALLSTETDEAFVQRVFLIEYIYDSNYGTNLKGKKQLVFTIENLYHVS